MSVRFFKWSKGILEILRFFGGAEKMLGGVRRKTLSLASTMKLWVRATTNSSQPTHTTLIIISLFFFF